MSDDEASDIDAVEEQDVSSPPPFRLPRVYARVHIRVRRSLCIDKSAEGGGKRARLGAAFTTVAVRKGQWLGVLRGKWLPKDQARGKRWRRLMNTDRVIKADEYHDAEHTDCFFFVSLRCPLSYVNTASPKYNHIVQPDGSKVKANVHYRYNEEQRMYGYVAARDIDEGEELFGDYKDEEPDFTQPDKEDDLDYSLSQP